MKLTRVWACLAACIISFCAFADSTASSLTANITLGLQFGGGGHRDDALRFTALLNVRSQLFRRTSEVERGRYRSDDSAGIANLTTGVPLVRVFELGVNRKGLDLAHVLGEDMLANSDQLNDDGDSHWYSHKWVWWAAGALAVGAGAAAAAGGHHSDTSNGNGGCDVASGPGVNGTNVNVTPASSGCAK